MRVCTFQSSLVTWTILIIFHLIKVSSGIPNTLEYTCTNSFFLYGNICRCPKIRWNPNLRNFQAYRIINLQCLPVYTQGPCNPGYYIVLRSGVPTCDYNPCRDATNIFYGGTCLKLNSRSSCGIIKLNPNDGFTPICAPDGPSSSSAYPLSLTFPIQTKSCTDPTPILSYDGRSCYPEAVFWDD